MSHANFPVQASPLAHVHRSGSLASLRPPHRQRLRLLTTEELDALAEDEEPEPHDSDFCIEREADES